MTPSYTMPPQLLLKKLHLANACPRQPPCTSPVDTLYYNNIDVMIGTVSGAKEVAVLSKNNTDQMPQKFAGEENGDNCC